MSQPVYRVNLLPPKLQREEMVDLGRLLLIAGITVLIACIIGAGGFFIINYYGMSGEIAAATVQAASLQPMVSNVENIRRQRMVMEAEVADYKALLHRQVTWSSLLYDLDYVAPTDLWLTQLQIHNVGGTAAPGTTGAAATSQQNPGAAGKGRTANLPEPYPRPNTVNISGESGSVTAIGIFVQNLKQLPYFSNIVINNISIATDGNEHFDITAIIKDEING